jgi:hypothetical protein
VRLEDEDRELPRGAALERLVHRELLAGEAPQSGSLVAGGLAGAHVGLLAPSPTRLAALVPGSSGSLDRQAMKASRVAPWRGASRRPSASPVGAMRRTAL